jgi:hypothetical protein
VCASNSRTTKASDAPLSEHTSSYIFLYSTEVTRKLLLEDKLLHHSKQKVNSIHPSKSIKGNPTTPSIFSLTNVVGVGEPAESIPRPLKSRAQKQPPFGPKSRRHRPD